MINSKNLNLQTSDDEDFQDLIKNFPNFLWVYYIFLNFLLKFNHKIKIDCKRFFFEIRR
jgi:hypothetical protein